MALSCSLATISFIGLLSLAGTPGASCGDDGITLSVIPPAKLEQIANEANQLKAASKWDDFRAKLRQAEAIHRNASEALAEQREALEQRQRELDAALARIERPQIMIQAILSEVQDLDDAVLKAACARVNAERVTTQALGSEPAIYTVSSEAAGRLLATIEKRRPMQVMSRPSILAVDGQIAEITIGQQLKRPVAARKSPKDEVLIEERDETVGLVVSLIPTVQDNRQLGLQFVVNNSALTGDSVPIFVNADGTTIDSPIIESAKMQTTLQTGDGRTVLVAVQSKKPADETEPTKTTLILLTPRIVDERRAATGEILHH
jgi:Flp pilus assembly secretin CpaC